MNPRRFMVNAPCKLNQMGNIITPCASTYRVLHRDQGWQVKVKGRHVASRHKCMGSIDGYDELV